ALSLDPCPLFSVRFYLSRNPELVARRVHAIIHYLQYGANEKRAPHPLFWPEWFLKNAPLHVPAERALESYLHDPALFGVAPNPYFNGAQYLECNPDVASAELNPL